MALCRPCLDLSIPNLIPTVNMSTNKKHSNDQAEDIQHHIKVYMNVFIALAVLTLVTVAVSYLEVSFIEAFFIAVTVATIKGSLVLSYFMHLLTEKPAVLWILATTMIAFLILMFIPLISMTDHASVW